MLETAYFVLVMKLRYQRPSFKSFNAIKGSPCCCVLCAEVLNAPLSETPRGRGVRHRDVFR